MNSEEVRFEIPPLLIIYQEQFPKFMSIQGSPTNLNSIKDDLQTSGKNLERSQKGPTIRVELNKSNIQGA